MTEDGARRGPKHPFNGRLVFDGLMFFATLLVGIVFYVLAFHPFG